MKPGQCWTYPYGHSRTGEGFEDHFGYLDEGRGSSPPHVTGIQALTTASKPDSDAKRAARGKSGHSTDTLDSSLNQIVITSLEDAKAEDIVTVALDEQAALADEMIIASGRSNRHVSAIADHLIEDLKANGRKDLRIEGLPHCDWVLIDAGDSIIHIFRPEVRSFYNLEKLWSADDPAN